MTAIALNSEGNYVMQGKQYGPQTIVAALEPLLTDNRRNKLNYVLNNRSYHCLPVMESIYDIGNVNAVMRSAELLGFGRLANIPSEVVFKKSSRITSGADRWIDVENFKDTESCLTKLKARGYTICATALRQDAVPFSELDLSRPRAFVFGNEKDGVSQKTLEMADECVIIPTVGFTESFNISVAAAIVMSKLYDYIHQHGDKYLINDDEKMRIKARQLLLQFKYSTVIKHLSDSPTV